MRPSRVLLAGVLLGFPLHALAQLPAPPLRVATIWVDDSGNGAATTRTWSDVNGSHLPDCTILNHTAHGECGSTVAFSPLPSLAFTVGADTGPGGLSGALMYVLPASIAGEPGDVVVDNSLALGLVPSMIIRFNGNGRVVVYSYSGASPVPLQANTKTLSGANPLTVYVPAQGEPGFGYSITGSFVDNYLVYVFRRPATRVTDLRYLPLTGGTLTGGLTAPTFNGDGANVTNLSPANISGGTASIDISGNAATADNATNAANALNAVNASNAGDAALLGGVSPADYARRDVANTFAGAQSVNGSLAIGGGAAITRHVSVTYSITLPSLKPNTCTNLPRTLAGAVAGANNTIALGVPGSFLSVGGFLMFQAWETGTDTINIRVCNVSPSGPASAAVTGTLRVDLWKH